MLEPTSLLERQMLAPRTAWQIGGPADWLAEPTTPDEVAELLRYAADRHLPVLALGGGSNLLMADAGYRGLVIEYADRTVSELEPFGSGHFRLGAGALFAPTARRLARAGFAGLEWAEGIPGTIGGAIAGNAGAYGGEIAEVVERVEVVTANVGRQEFTRAECRFQYRTSRFKTSSSCAEFIVAATVALHPGDAEALDQRMKQIGAERKRKTPAGLSCGSVFKNPPGEHAGALIERAGLKGRRAGGAEISTIHANYIVNRDGASAADVRALIELARAEVARQFGIELEPEVRLVGF